MESNLNFSGDNREKRYVVYPAEPCTKTKDYVVPGIKHRVI